MSKNSPTVSEYDGLLAAKKKARRKEAFRQTLPLYLMMLPGIVYLICNNYLPMFGILLAFKKVNFSIGIFKSPSAKAIQPIICFPSMVSAVILSYIVYAFLSTNFGYLNHTLFKDNPINWYATAKYWPLILTIVHFWQCSGQSSIIYMASIGGIDKGLYESARIDGASKLRQIFSITLPLLKPMITLMLLMSISKIFNSDFGMFYQVPLNSGMIFKTTQTIDTYVYRALLEMNNVGMSSAASVFQAVLGFILVMISNAVVKLVDEDSALF